MGQVSLPVLSRKGKYDNWNNSWTSFKNYSLMFNEDLFLKKFLFLFFMYGISYNKNFLPIFFKTTPLTGKQRKLENYNLVELTKMNINNYFTTPPHNKFYITKIFLCRYINWVYIYLYIYSITNIRLKTLNSKKKLKIFNKTLFYQAYCMSKYKYIASCVNFTT